MVAERLSSALGLSEDDGSSEVSKIQLILAPVSYTHLLAHETVTLISYAVF